jgi:hypothetical protein
VIGPRICEKHWKTATFAVEWDGFDGPRRELCCDEDVADTMRYALLSGSFTPPVVAPIDLDAHRPWDSTDARSAA